MLLPLKKKRKLCVMKKDTHMSPPPLKKKITSLKECQELSCLENPFVVLAELYSFISSHIVIEPSIFFFKKVIKETRAWKDEKLLCHVKRCSLAPFIEKTNHLIKKMSKIVVFEQHTCHAWRERLRSVMYFAFENREKYCVIYFEPFLF